MNALTRMTFDTGWLVSVQLAAQYVAEEAVRLQTVQTYGEDGTSRLISERFQRELERLQAILAERTN